MPRSAFGLLLGLFLSGCSGHTTTILFDPPQLVFRRAEPPVASPVLPLQAGESRPITATQLEKFRIAIEMDDVARLEKSIAEGVSVNRVLSDGNTPLIFAMQSGSMQVVEWLLRNPRLQVNQKNSANDTALMTAAGLGEIEWVRRLLARGGEINRPAGQWSALHYAAANARLSVVQMLCARTGTLVDAPSANGTTPLMMAARANATDVVKFLLEKGARWDLENQAGLTASAYAQRNGNAEMAAMIRQYSIKTKRKEN